MPHKYNLPIAGTLNRAARTRTIIRNFLKELRVNFWRKRHVLTTEKVSACFDLKRYSNCFPSLGWRFHPADPL